MKYITHFNYGKTKGYLVRIKLCQSVKGKYNIDISKFFATRKYKNALRMARRFRDRSLASLKKRGYLWKRQHAKFHPGPTIKSKSGIVGVYVQVRPDGLRYWRATYYPVPYKDRTASFSVNKFGERKAKQLAIEFRDKGIVALKKTLSTNGKRKVS